LKIEIGKFVNVPYFSATGTVDGLTGRTGREGAEWFRNGIGAVIKCHQKEAFEFLRTAIQ